MNLKCDEHNCIAIFGDDDDEEYCDGDDDYDGDDVYYDENHARLVPTNHS